MLCTAMRPEAAATSRLGERSGHVLSSAATWCPRNRSTENSTESRTSRRRAMMFRSAIGDDKPSRSTSATSTYRRVARCRCIRDAAAALLMLQVDLIQVRERPASRWAHTRRCCRTPAERLLSNTINTRRWDDYDCSMYSPQKVEIRLK